MEELSSYAQAIALNNRILAHADAAQRSLYEVCKGLKEMRDGKLYKELGYQNFAAYCEQEVGITSRQANKYILIIDRLGENFGNPGLQKLGVKKLYLLSTLSESDRTELTERVNIEDTTTRQLQAEIDKLKTEKAALQQENQRIDSQRADLADRVQDLYTSRDALQKQVKELESRPIEVAVQESREDQNLRAAMAKMENDWREEYDKLQEECTQSERALHQTYKQQLKEMQADYEKKLVEAEESGGAEQAYLKIVRETIRTAVRNFIGNDLPLFRLQQAVESEMRDIQKLMRKETEQ